MQFTIENTARHCLLAVFMLACGCHASPPTLKTKECVCAPHGACAGFFSTCWRQWPSECTMCPPAIEPTDAAVPFGPPPLNGSLENVPPPAPMPSAPPGAMPAAPPSEPSESEEDFPPAAMKKKSLRASLQALAPSKPAVKPAFKQASVETAARRPLPERGVLFTEDRNSYRGNTLELRKPPAPKSHFRSDRPVAVRTQVN